MTNNRRPQAPKRRNFVAKNVHKVHRPQTFRDRTKYDRYEDYLKDQLDNMVGDEVDAEIEVETKKKFVAAIAGKEYDPDDRKNYEDWLDAQYVDDNLETWEDYADDYTEDDFDNQRFDDYDY